MSFLSIESDDIRLEIDVRSKGRCTRRSMVYRMIKYTNFKVISYIVYDPKRGRLMANLHFTHPSLLMFLSRSKETNCYASRFMLSYFFSTKE